jgi:ParB-like chromosome segregation protein Spo0J
MKPEILRAQTLPISKVVPIEKGALDEGHVARLAESLRTLGMLVPVVVSQVRGDDSAYYLHAGYARCAALKRLGMSEVVADVLLFDSKEELLTFTGCHFALAESVRQGAPA